MFGIVIGSHGSCADGIVDSCKMILGERLVSQTIRAVTLGRGEGVENVIEKYKAAIADLGSPARVLFLTDLRGGSPYNAASILAVGDEHYGIVSGFNLPMLVAMIQEQIADDGTEDINTIINKAVDAGREGVAPTTYAELNAPPAEDEDEME